MRGLSTALTATTLLASDVFAANKPGVTVKDGNKRKECTVYPYGGNRSDVSNIISAFKQCGSGGTIIFPEKENYFIDQKLNPVVNDVSIEWRGTWTFSPDIAYWRLPQNHYPIAFQNHAASFVLTGDGIDIDGYGTGGIYGNGDVWYTAEAGTTLPGRPMPFVFWNVSSVTLSNFKIIDPPLWHLNIMNGTDLALTNITCNATATKAPYGKNWVQNTDGFDTMDVTNAKLTNFVYQGGDDCVAVKPRTYGLTIRNAACHGGNGIAIGSLGQYLEDSSVENVIVDNVDIIRRNEDMHNAAYIKTWTGIPVNTSGYESGNTYRGGGWGYVRNILFSNFRIQGSDSGPAITQDNGANSSTSGTSLLEISNVAFVNFTGYLSGAEKANRTASVSCGRVHPCYNIEFEDVALTVTKNSTYTGVSTCSLVAPGGVHGLSGSGCT